MLTPYGYQDNLTVRRLYWLLSSESDCIVVCNCTLLDFEWVERHYTQIYLLSPRRNRSPPKLGVTRLFVKASGLRSPLTAWLASADQTANVHAGVGSVKGAFGGFFLPHGIPGGPMLITRARENCRRQ